MLQVIILVCVFKASQEEEFPALAQMLAFCSCLSVGFELPPLIHQGVASDGVYVNMEGLSPDIKPTVHSIATQTSHVPSAAAAFFIRLVNATQLSVKAAVTLCPDMEKEVPEG